MGYDVHITRKPEWSEETGPVITLAEWLDYIQKDPEMRLEDAAEPLTPEAENTQTSDQVFAVWTAYSGHNINGNMAWFTYFEDCIFVKNPDTEILQKMHKIAVSLGAKVQGDDGEEYDAMGDVLATTSDQPALTPTNKKPWWRFW